MTTVGILGGGQLGRMLALAAAPLGVKTVVLDPSAECPAASVATEVEVGAFTDEASIRRLAAKCDVITCEIEHVNAEALVALEKEGFNVQPSGQSIHLIQDKYLQKRHLIDNGIHCPKVVEVVDAAGLQSAIEMLGIPLMLKSRKLAYDGRGNYAVKSAADIPAALEFLAGKGALFAEQWVYFAREIAVLVARSGNETTTYPVVETVQNENMCHLAFIPCHSNPAVQTEATHIALEAVKTFTGSGVFAVEMFELPEGTVMVNEIAPRVHNSGHLTMEACVTSQFEQHIRCVTHRPLGSTALKVPAATMVNIVGQNEDLPACFSYATSALAYPGAALHWYGKEQCRKGRKMGHVTFTGDTKHVQRSVAQFVRVPTPTVAPLPQVSIIMGSDSDLSTMGAAAAILQKFDIPFEMDIVSAHRTPEKMVSYAKAAASRGLQVIIAGAGGAAHLPGMVASLTTLPVIGVPVPIGHLQGVDALHSIVQMPKGIPVATVAIGNATNAGLLAARIIGATNPSVADKLLAYQKDMMEEVSAKSHKLQSTSWESYLSGMPKPA